MTLGVIGGMGPAATVDFLRRVIELTPAERDQDHLHMLIDNDPSVPDRTEGWQKKGPDPSPQLARMARGLEAAGADLLVMPCNSAHLFAEAVTSAVRIPLVDWPSVVAQHAAARGVSAVGLLATTGTVEGEIYQRALAARGCTAVKPDPGDQAAVMSVIEQIKAGKHQKADAAAAIRRVGTSLVAEGADALLLACTELSTLIAGQAELVGDKVPVPVPVPVPVLDAVDILARHVVSLAHVQGGQYFGHMSIPGVGHPSIPGAPAID
jgi:aspartate racemase